MKDIWREIFERAYVVVILIGAIIFILGITGGITGNAVSLQIKDDFGRIAGVAVGVILFGLGIVWAWRRESQSKVDSNIEVLPLANTEELYKYARKRIEQAKEQINDTTWGTVEDELKIPLEKNAYDEYLEAIVRVCKKGTVRYQEIMGFHPVINIEKRIKRVEHLINQNLFSYHLKYVEYSLEQFPPLLSFLTIDNEEVILAFYSSRDEDETIRLAIKNPQVVNFFKGYHKSIWDFAKWLKQGGTFYEDEFEKLKKRLT